ncbi:hypothetical protein D9M73_272700 [compost metagenome]
MLGQQVVLCAALEVFTVGIDKQHLALALGRLGADAVGPFLLLLAQDQDTGRDAGAIEQVGWQADHGFEQVVLDNAGADAALLTATE